MQFDCDLYYIAFSDSDYLNMDQKQLSNFWPNIEKKDDKECVTFELQPLNKLTVMFAL